MEYHMATFIWIASTVGLWFLSVQLMNLAEIMTINRVSRLAAMATAGSLAGFSASLIGYQFFLLSILLAVQLIRHRQRSKEYWWPAGMTFILIATIASYAFSIEVCDSGGQQCARVFFNWVYTPPHLR